MTIYNMGLWILETRECVLRVLLIYKFVIFVIYFNIYFVKNTYFVNKENKYISKQNTKFGSINKCILLYLANGSLYI